MASKRKKSRPTRITKEDVPAVGDGLDGSSYYEEDTLTEIQRYIEEGSEDTPDCLERKLVQSGESEVECVPPDTECGPSSRLDISEDAACYPLSTQKQESECVEGQFEDVSNSRELQLWKQRVRQAIRRDNESEEKRALRLSLNRDRQACRRRNESSEARRIRLERGRERQAYRRKNESEEERKLRLARHRLQQADRRKNESDSARQLRLTSSRERQAARRRNESQEERELRLLKNRLRQADRRKNETNKACEPSHPVPVLCELTGLEDQCASHTLESIISSANPVSRT